MVNISVCIITANEASNLERCLSLIKRYPFEIVVVDTGSTDNSVETALKYTDKVYHFKWCNDFSAARNYSISRASNDYILVVDTDEMLAEIDYAKLCEQIQKNTRKVGRIKRTNIFFRNDEEEKATERVNRIFDRTLFKYEGRIHEQIIRIDGNKYDTYSAAISFDHEGYNGTKQELEKKTSRNIELLLKMHVENPDDPYILYQLGKSYYMSGDMESAYEYFGQTAAYDLDPALEYVTDMVISYGYSMLNTGRATEALGFENMVKEFGHIADYRFLMGLIYMNNMLFDEAVREFENAVSCSSCIVKGTNSYKALYNIGVIKECLGDTKGACKMYSKCEKYKKAEDRLKKLEQW